MTDPTWIGLDRGDTDLSAAEHLASEVGPELLAIASLACTHVISDPFGHYAVSLEIPRELATGEQEALIDRAARASCGLSIDDDRLVMAGEPDLQSGALLAAAQHRDRSAGRAFRYPGDDRMRGDLTVAAVMAGSAIERVEALGANAGPTSLVLTRDFVRPQLRDGALVLVVTPRGEDVFQPFESKNPHACCEDHSG